jgi:NTE family protein
VASIHNAALQAVKVEDDSSPVEAVSKQSPAYLAQAPVTSIPSDPQRDAPEDGIALCLSGGGYRAMLFHLGSLWRLNELGLVAHLKRVSSVSGGSITAATLALAWDDLGFNADGVAQKFKEQVAMPLHRLAGKTLDVQGMFLGLCLGLIFPGIAGRYVAWAYRRHLFKGRKLRDLPDDSRGKAPRFVINATNMQTTALWRFERPYMADYLVGCIGDTALVDMATAVAASSAFPPFLSPIVLNFKEGDYKGCPPEFYKSKPRLGHPSFTTRVILTDGGVYDNLGLETAWKKYRTVLVSDGGAKTAPDPHPAINWFGQFMRVREAEDNQVRSLRKRQLKASYDLPEGTEGHRFGTYWSMRIDIKEYHVPGVLCCPFKETFRLANEPTRLASLDGHKQKQLVNWGYAVCDAAVRLAASQGKLQLERKLEPPGGFPYPEVAWHPEECLGSES